MRPRVGRRCTLESLHYCDLANMLSSIQLRVVVLALGFLACAGPALSGNVFRKGDVAFRVGPIPEHWRLLEDPRLDGDLASFAFRSDERELTVGAAGRCGRDSDDVPLASLTRHLTIGFTDREVIAERNLTLAGRAALRTEMTAKLDGVQKHLVFVVVKKDYCVYDFWRISDAAPGDSSEFDRFVAGFMTLD